MSDTFRAIVLDETDTGVSASLKTLSTDDLPDGEVLIDVAYSDLNYKDGMILGGLGRMVRRYPHVPGIDYAGTVIESRAPAYKPGDEVILTGWRVGETHWGGYAEKARAQAGWLVPLPTGMSLKRSMALGTAGFTAMLAVMALEEHGLSPQSEGEVLVTGASGGVGSIAVALLANLGYRVAASTGREEQHAYLRDLGATTIVSRSELETPPKGPLGSERWAGAIDNVGGQTLATVLAGLRFWGSCAAVGLAASPNYPGNVVPFLLRGVNLLGIDSGNASYERRMVAWNRLARELPMDKLDAMTRTIGLDALPAEGKAILANKIHGRTVVDVKA